VQHLDHDRLVFLALGETEAETGEARHLGDCEHCRVEVETLRHVAGLGAETQGLRVLPDPPERIWHGIAAEIAAAEALPSLSDARRQQPAPGAAEPEAPVVRPASRRRSRVPRWLLTTVTATAAAALGVVGTLVVLRPADPEPQPQPAVLASAPLSAYGATPKDANGDARVFKDGRLHLHVANLPDVPGYYEVWLINPTSMQMSVTEASVNIKSCLAFSIRARTWHCLGVSPKTALNKRMK
jgi:hypothetical protein